ncbi:arginine--tRNA ligase [Bariatricus massiliensis]|uniref:Arginine--tRNA ligase n=1 Tax=Bariatricus massiliensis TaxID=1745713 RepID=A0ABS8DCM7_9FIRM|nr:arginine--tRNA ligase [Bariatricus massiliensis]MCB7303791.1 arginine--tRNA ligase [Bariatricus massiliensis]MCB7373207.1 arginine--tRNA ligase [Bariatricus massiliensis]MCB7385877.1 arginine--tRNA ligase [Bariatricus massiliensis]MCB7410039.1 arginine--tRNA ligase [Bariatricus massiliensis]MCQ5252993.1 arginine--tRNA ligase [Bariatricus massiliensis]
MKTILDLITDELEQAFEEAGYDKELAKVTLSNRPDLCEYQCNGAMAGAKKYHKAPIMIANDVVEKLSLNNSIKEAEAVNPGFINLRTNPEFVAHFLNLMSGDKKLGVEEEKTPKNIIIDYGGPNVAKPLHVGHLRSAIIGESLKRINRFMGNHVTGDIHLGDWGYQMGLIITEIKKRQPELPYFDDEYTGEYPEEAPFTIGDLEEIYPTASAYAKEHEEYRDAALQATFELQNGKRGYRALWNHIMNVSVNDLKKNYSNLNVEFDLWKGEADAQKYIPDMVERLKAEGYAHLDEGALVVDVKEDADTKEVPPCMILKSDGAALYDTTDLATLVEREELFRPDEVIYVVDKRQELHFVQVFRCAKKTGIVREETKLSFLGFGTMNGKDGKPFKTREGGIMRLEHLIADITGKMYEKITDNRTVSDEEAEATAKVVGLAAIKYGDLSNQASKDYVFDIDRFISFEGNTGPYILYTIVRIKSILAKYEQAGNTIDDTKILAARSESEKALMLEACRFNSMMETVYEELAPHKICAYVYELANAFNRFYHETKILAEEDAQKQKSYIGMLKLTRDILNTCIDLLGFEAPERM